MTPIPVLILAVTLYGQKHPAPIGEGSKTPQLSRELKLKLDRLHGQLTQPTRLKVQRTGSEVLRKSMAPNADARELSEEASLSMFKGRPSSNAVDTLAVLIMGEMAKGTDADLRTLAAEMKLADKRKSAYRSLRERLLKTHSELGTMMMPMRMLAPPVKHLPNTGLDYIPAPNVTAPSNLSRLSKEEVGSLYLKLRDALYQGDQCSQKDALAMEMLQGKQEKLLEVLSNVLKKVQDVGKQIISNMK